MTDDKEKLGKVVAKLKIQLWADDVLVAESFDEKVWSQTLREMPIADEVAKERERLQEIIDQLQAEAKNFKDAEKSLKATKKASK